MGTVEGACGGLEPLVRIIYSVLTYIKWIVPIALLALASVDVFRAIISNDEKEEKAARSRVLKRVIYAVVIFLIPALINIVMAIVAKAVPNDNNTQSWHQCWYVISEGK